MTERTRRAPTGAALLQPHITSAITDSVLHELAARGYGRLSMEAVAKRAGVSKSALYRRWPSKQDMVIAVLSEFSVAQAEVSDTGSLRGDLLATLRAVRDWVTHPRFATILPDLVAEATRNPTLAGAIAATIGEPRRALGAVPLRRAIDRGELPADLDLELALDLVAAPVYWRLTVRQAPAPPDYLDRLADHIVRALRG
ncbi:Transcriptional regulator, TetR family [Actinokineospora spheciospongiae]|uniref:Transcriptional regulator, TetR family n=1 Tax=Actinokineospora spheciospongiae TaxID=909613 RepID=W7IG24_9PSEU|nr:TetR/AcrR family transcriptional regulator [Actinokineospora spheciospongiae]EWC59845.1 Transcriptional regulator, TetR family [Actinokineospora spheciospongiae]PWW63123.1 TetR family transcriptional regulator [Actinokineospora spheciospongiae]